MVLSRNLVDVATYQLCFLGTNAEATDIVQRRHSLLDFRLDMLKVGVWPYLKSHESTHGVRSRADRSTCAGVGSREAGDGIRSYFGRSTFQWQRIDGDHSKCFLNAVVFTVGSLMMTPMELARSY